MLIVTDPVDTAAIAAAAHALGLHERGGVLPLPAGANERGARMCGLAGGGDDLLAAIEAGQVRALVLLRRRPDRRVARRRPLADGARPGRAVVAVAAVREHDRVVGALRAAPGASTTSARARTTNLEGRIQRLRAGRRQPPSGVPDLAAYVALAGHLGIEVAPAPSRAYGQMASDLGIPLAWSELNGRAPLPARTRGARRGAAPRRPAAGRAARRRPAGSR